MVNEENLIKLRELMAAEFGEDDLRQLCRDLDLDFETLPGLGVFGKTRSIIESTRRRNQLPVLLARVRELRPAAYAAAGIQLESAPAAATGSQPSSSPPGASAAQPKSSRSAIAWIAGLLILALVVVVVLALFTPRPEASAPGASTTEATAAQAASATPILVAVTGTQSLTPSPAAPVEATAAPEPTATEPTEPTAVPASPTPRPTPTVSETHVAAQSVVTANQQLMDFMQGKITRNDLQRFWRGAAYQKILSFVDGKALRKFGVNLSAGQKLDAQMEYVKPPAVAALGNNTATVMTREYWRYANPNGDQEACDIRNYTYVMALESGLYRVKDFNSEVLDTKCRK